ncbi:MAG: hypothetical protein LH614_14325 [Pyrinomonadaceae bacterium]|nr:hypothetical protein [Pyrinomonadaceae bacterium]
MNERKFNQQNLRAYLLGELPEAEAERFDELSFTENEFAEALGEAENDLVDAYVGDGLSGAKLERFKAHYLASPLRREKVEFAKNFRTYAEKHNAPEIFKTSASEVKTEPGEAGFFAGVFSNLRLLQLGFATAALALMVTGGWLFVENSRLRNRFDESLAQQAELERREKRLRDEIAAQSNASAEKEAELARIREELARVEKEREQQRQITEREQQQKETLAKRQPIETPRLTAAPRAAFFALAPPLRGGGSLPTISVPANADTVTIRLELEPNDFTRYRVALKTQTGERILWRSGSLRAQTTGENKILNVSFPARLLRVQTYSLEVSGIGAGGKPEIVSDYFFRNVR